MPLRADSKEAWRRALADEAAYRETIAILDDGTFTSLSGNAKIVLGNALGLSRALPGVIAAFESGAQLSDEDAMAVRNMVGDVHGIGSDIVTRLNLLEEGGGGQGGG